MKLIFSFLLISVNFMHLLGLQCVDERNNEVDWVLAYKLPALPHENELIEKGISYMYITSANYSAWTLSEIPINATNSLLANIISKLYGEEKNYSYILYNDEIPSNKDSEKGHNKGVILADIEGGLWLIHSVPKFPYSENYVYPTSGMKFGQSFLCMSLPLNEMDAVGLQLQYNEPNIYYQSIQTEIKDRVPHLTAAAANVIIKEAPWYNQIEINSLQGTSFFSFAKSKHFGKDLYEDWVAPVLQTNLLVETWADGPGRLRSNCSQKFKVKNIQSIAMSTLNITFKSTHDHSKWAVSSPNEIGSWLCVGDINRAEPQERRGGGTVCYQNEKVSEDYKEFVGNVEECT